MGYVGEEHCAGWIRFAGGCLAGKWKDGGCCCPEREVGWGGGRLREASAQRGCEKFRDREAARGSRLARVGRDVLCRNCDRLWDRRGRRGRRGRFRRESWRDRSRPPVKNLQ